MGYQLSRRKLEEKLSHTVSVVDLTTRPVYIGQR